MIRLEEYIRYLTTKDAEIIQDIHKEEQLGRNAEPDLKLDRNRLALFDGGAQ